MFLSNHANISKQYFHLSCKKLKIMISYEQSILTWCTKLDTLILNKYFCRRTEVESAYSKYASGIFVAHLTDQPALLRKEMTRCHFT